MTSINSEAHMRDPLTGVYSRYSFEDRLPEEVERARRHGEELCLLVADLDHFKSVNDTFGHLRGDQALIQFAARMRAMLRGYDLLFRFGGEEFVVLLPRTGKQNGSRLANRLLEGVRSKPFPGTPDLTLTMSIGLACFPDDAENSEDLFEKADSRLYVAKRQGRNRVVEEDPPVASVPPLAEDVRLVEREEALETLARFLAQLPQRRRGVLVVTGRQGSGKTRFLREVARASRMRGFLVVDIRARAALKGRAYGALAEALKEQGADLPAGAPEEGFSEVLQHLLKQRGSQGVLLTVDELADLDWETVEVVRWLFASSPIEVTGLAYAADPESSRKSFPAEAPLREAVEMEALSHSGTRTLVCHALGWEPPQGFLGWLHDETDGLPARLYKGLVHLLRRGTLARDPEEGWGFGHDYRGVELRERLHVEERLPSHNLPVPLTSFLGRTREIDEVKQRLSRRRMVSIIGSGGIGKTRLALQVAAEMMRQFGDGVYMAQLSTLSSPDSLATAVADAIGLSSVADESLQAQLINYLADRRVLLVLDGFDAVMAGRDLVSEILGACNEARILVTSRERVAVPEESILRLEGLPVLSEEAEDRGGAASAQQLFIQSARRVDPGFELRDTLRPAIERICRLVEGTPLAIELAASWVTTLECDEIADEIAGGLDFLGARLRDVPERHRSLRAVFQGSWDLLSEEQKDVLTRLSVFRGGFRRRAAESVAAASPRTLIELADKSLLRRSLAGRFAVPEVLRTYAEEKLRETQTEFAATADRHAAYFGNFLREAEPHLRREKQRQVFSSIAEEIENIRSGWRRALDRGQAELLSDYVMSLASFCQTRCRFREGERMFGEAAQRFRDAARGSRPQRLVPSLYGRLIAARGGFLFRLGKLQEAREELEHSVTVHLECGDRRWGAWTSNMLGNLALREGRHADAKKHYSEALQAGRDLGDPSLQGRSLSHMGMVAFAAGDCHEAARLNKQGLEMCSQVMDRGGAGVCLNSLGNISDLVGDRAEARKYYEECLEISRELGDREGVAIALNNLGNIARRLGEYQECKRLHEQSLRISREVGSSEGTGYGLNALGYICCMLGQLEEARRYQEESLALYQRAGDRSGAAYSLDGLGEIELAQGNYAAAADLFGHSVRLFRELDERWGLASTLNSLGRAALAMGQSETAEEHLGEALRHGLDVEAPPLLLEILVSWARLLETLGRKVEAIRLLLGVRAHPLVEAENRDEAEQLLRTFGWESPRETEEQSSTAEVDVVAVAGWLLGGSWGQPGRPPDHKQKDDRGDD